MLEVLAQIFFELILQIFGEILLALGFRSLAEPLKKREEQDLGFAFVGYGLLGLALGGLSLLIFPQSFARSPEARNIGLILIPLLSGIIMAGLGWLRIRRGKRQIRLDSFSYGSICAFGMAIVRFKFAT
jgi:hypothetical protein